MPGELVHLADRRPAPSPAEVTGQLVGGEFFVVVTVRKGGKSVEARLSLAAARAYLEQLEVTLDIGEGLARR